MGLLHFTFKSDNVNVYDEVVNVEQEEDYYTFVLDEQNFKFRINETFHFIKEKDDERFEIIGGENPKVLVSLKEENATFLVEIISFNHKVEENKHIISYMIESDKDDLKTIIFKFE